MAAPSERYAQISETLIDHPKTTRACRSLKVHRLMLVGHLTCFWNWAMKNAPDGDLSRLSARDIADAARYTDKDSFEQTEDEKAEAFVKALTDCHVTEGGAGFFEVVDSRLCIHDWQQYGGRLNEMRERNARKVADWRAKQTDGDECNGNVTVTEPAGNGHLVRAHSERSGAEQSREKRSVEKQSRADAARGADQLPEDPACPALPSDVNVNSALPPPDVTVGVLTEADVGDLRKSRWTLPEILWGCAILHERPKLPENAKGLLHTSILPEVREGRRPKNARPPPVSDSERATAKREAELAEFERNATPEQRRAAAEMQANDAEILALRDIQQTGSEEEKRAAQQRIRQLAGISTGGAGPPPA